MSPSRMNKKQKFHEQPGHLSEAVPHVFKSFLPGNLKARMGTDYTAWPKSSVTIV